MVPEHSVEPSATHWFRMQGDVPPQHLPPHRRDPAAQHTPLAMQSSPARHTRSPHLHVHEIGDHCFGWAVQEMRVR
jgi:hypothetical protein